MWGYVLGSREGGMFPDENVLSAVDEVQSYLYRIC